MLAVPSSPASFSLGTAGHEAWADPFHTCLEEGRHPTHPTGSSSLKCFPRPLPIRLPFALTLFSFFSPQPPRPHPVGYCSRLQEGHSSEVFPGSPLWTRRAFAGIQGWKICVSGTRPRRHGKGNGKPRGKTTGRSGTVREERASVKEESPLWGPAAACPAAPAIYSRHSCMCVLWGEAK